MNFFTKLWITSDPNFVIKELILMRNMLLFNNFLFIYAIINVIICKLPFYFI